MTTKSIIVVSHTQGSNKNTTARYTLKEIIFNVRTRYNIWNVVWDLHYAK